MYATTALFVLFHTAPATQPAEIRGAHTIHALGALDYCVQPKDQSSALQTPIVLAKCSGAAAQEWAFDRGRLTSLGKCLSVVADAESGAQAALHDCEDGAVAQWIVQGARVELANTSLCLDIPFGFPNGAHLHVAECGLGPEQSFDVNAARDEHVSVGPIALAHDAHACLSVQPESEGVNGTPITLASCDPQTPDAQVWTYKQGTLMQGDRCITAASPSMGAPVVIADCVAWMAQSWNAKPGAHLQLAGRALCLDALRDDPVTAVQLVVSPCQAESDTQMWAVPNDR